jgi:predicted nucleic acid-binding protein
VLDASAAIDLCLALDGFELLASHDLVSPPLLPSEVLSGLSELRWRRQISQDLAEKAVLRVSEAPVRLERPDGHLRRAWDVALRLGWAKTYDAEYVAVALALGCPILTLDARLQRGAGHIVRILSPADII